MRVLTLTLNPAIDQTVTLDRLVPGAVHRASAVRQNAGGKGVNVASCLADWGVAVAAHGLLGRDNAAPFEALFAAKAIADQCQRVAGATRVNLKLVDAAGTTDINLAGPPAAPATLAAAADGLCAAAQQGDLVVLAGSLPPGAPDDTYARLTARLRAQGCTVLLDTSGAPLNAALAAHTLPNVLKPNHEELAQWLGQPHADRAALLTAAHALVARGAGLVVVSMGAEGALFVSAQGALHAQLAAGAITSTVGAGDAMVAGIAAGWVAGAGLGDLARLASAFAVGKLGLAGPNLPPTPQIQALAAQVEITALTPAR